MSSLSFIVFYCVIISRRLFRVRLIHGVEVSSLSFIVFYCVIISLDTTLCPWIERLNPKSLVCKTQPTTLGPKDLVHNPL